MKHIKKSQPDRKRADLALSRVRSAVTNGTTLLAGVDGRSARMRRLKDLIGGHVADLGGRDLLSQAEFCIVRRCALLTLELELLEARFEINDGAKAAELECYQRVASSLRRMLESLGLQRRQKDVGPRISGASCTSRQPDRSLTKSLRVDQGRRAERLPRLKVSGCQCSARSRSKRRAVGKEKTSHKIDVVIALAMAALAAVQRGDSRLHAHGNLQSV